MKFRLFGAAESPLRERNWDVDYDASYHSEMRRRFHELGKSW